MDGSSSMEGGCRVCVCSVCALGQKGERGAYAQCL